MSRESGGQRRLLSRDNVTEEVGNAICTFQRFPAWGSQE